VACELQRKMSGRDRRVYQAYQGEFYEA